MGLRREEVSALAKVSFTWYSWFESGRRSDVSEEFLERLSGVLQLTAIETEYLFALAGLKPKPAVSADARKEPSHQALDIIHGFTAGPAFVVDHRYNILAWNSICAALFGYDKASPGSLNLLHNFFATERAKRVHVDWERTSKQVVGTFRLEFARHIDDEVYPDIIGGISRSSPEFQRLWNKQFVSNWPESFLFVVPEIGREVITSFAIVNVDGESDEKIHLHTFSDPRVARRLSTKLQ